LKLITDQLFIRDFLLFLRFRFAPGGRTWLPEVVYLFRALHTKKRKLFHNNKQSQNQDTLA